MRAVIVSRPVPTCQHHCCYVGSNSSNWAPVASATAGRSRDPMLFIHGAGIADAFVPLMNRPPLAGLQQIHYRHRGYGQSTAAGGPPESFMASAAADAAQLLAHLRVDAAHVVGHSSGALIALDLACNTPHAVRSLALLEPPLLGVPSTGPHMAALTPAVERYAARGSSMRAEQHRSGSLCSS